MTSDLYKSTDHINRQFVDRTDTVSTARISTDTIKTLPETVVLTSKEISSSNDSLIWSHPFFGIWDDFNWAEDDDALIFDSFVSRVVNRNDTFIERFAHNDFIDSSNTTASVNLGSGVTFDLGEVFQTETIALNDCSFSSFNVSMEGVNTSSLSVSIINSGVDGFKVKLENNEGLFFPLTFPATFTGGEVSLTRLTVAYY